MSAAAWPSGVRVLDAGDAAFTIEFGDAIDPALRAAVNALDAALARCQTGGGLPGVIETVPTFRSLTVLYDPLRTTRATLVAAIEALLAAGPASAAGAGGQRWRLPVCYEGEFAPDLAATAHALGLGEDALVEAHSATEYAVYMLGFLPGFPFMGDLPAPLRLPRRAEPRVRVPAGSVAIATGLTAIYPWESPGGWHLLGRCPLRLFDATRAAPSLLEAGDRVRFTPVSGAEYHRLAAALAAGELTAEAFLADAEGG